MKTENKIILMIGIGFSLLLLVFIWFASRVFDTLSFVKQDIQHQQKMIPIQELQSNFKAAQKDIRRGLDVIQHSMEENHKKHEEKFDNAVESFATNHQQKFNQDVKSFQEIVGKPFDEGEKFRKDFFSSL